MNFTPQQQTIIDYAKNNEGLIKVNAIAGAGKTTLLVGLAKTIQPKKGLYLAYNKSIATESAAKFPDYIDCRTTHSMAYRETVIPYKLWLGHFSYKDITEPMNYINKLVIIDLIKEFCLSEFVSFNDFAELDKQITPFQIKLANKYLNLMATGEVQCTHDFYLKYYHMLLENGDIKDPGYDLIMLDESGDLNPVTLEIFKLLPAKRKVMVGDQHQNIYTFNHTINCFKEMKDEGVLFPMTQSFRVGEHIAERIEKFCKSYIDENMEFKGIPLRDSVINTKAYIARTNSQLVSKMIELNDMNIKYSLTRSAKAIFRVPLLFCGLNKTSKITDPEYVHIEDDISHYYEDVELQKEKTLLGYIKDKHDSDVGLQAAVSMVLNHGAQEIFRCFERAKLNEKLKTNYTLCSVHSSKGLEFDEVEIAPDLAKTTLAIQRHINGTGIPLEDLDEEMRTELNLYYVAVSRARKRLINASI